LDHIFRKFFIVF